MPSLFCPNDCVSPVIRFFVVNIFSFIQTAIMLSALVFHLCLTRTASHRIACGGCITLGLSLVGSFPALCRRRHSEAARFFRSRYSSLPEKRITAFPSVQFWQERL